MANIYDKSSLVLIPSGTKTGKIFSQKPVSGDGDFTFTRSSAATRVNADGNIEKETQNLLLHSNTFTDSSWIHGSITLTSGQSGYDGGSNAWKLDKSATSYTSVYQDVSQSGVQTISIYVKEGTLNTGALYADGGTADYSVFDLTNGNNSTNTSGVIDAGSTNEGNGWYRLYMVVNKSVTRVRFYPDWSNSTAGNVYVQDFQLNQGLIPQEVITTTTSAVYGGITDNVPRLDYTDSSCPALLLEPSRRNAMPHSEYISTSDFSISANVVFTNNYALSPEGVENATRVQFGATGSNEIFYDRGVGNYGKKNTISFYVKGTSGETINTYVDGNANPTGYYFFQKDITLTGDWQRVENTFDLPLNAGASNFVIRRRTTDTATEILLYGYEWQVDTAGGDASYATSYIPTYGSSVSRVADACNTLNVEELIGQTEGTIFYQGLVEKATGNDGHAIAFTQDANGNGSSRFLLYRSNSTGNMKVYFQNTSGVAFGQATLPIPTSSNDKYAIAYSTNDLAIYVNGVLEHTQSVGVIPTTKFVNINRWTGNMKHKNECRNVLLFQTRLSNQELADLTTL